MSVFSSHGSARRRFLTTYVLIWATAAGLAAAYLAILGVRPDLLSAGRSGPDLEQEIAQTRREMQRGFADLEPLRQTVGAIKLEVANLALAAQQATDRDVAILERVGALEGTTARLQETAKPAGPAAAGESAAAPAAAPPPPTPDPRRSSPKPAPAAAAPQSNTPKEAQVLNGKAKDAAVETGSIAPADKPPVKAASKPAPVGVLLATGPSLDALRLNWSILADRHADAVSGLNPRYVVSGGGDGRTYGLVAGPVANAEQARNLCTIMTARGQSCEVSVYRGNAL